MSTIRLHARAVFLVATSRIMLRRLRTTATLRRLTAHRRRLRHVDPTAALVAVRRAARVVGGECLPQAVSIAVLLERGGYEPSLILGCGKNGEGTWIAHAWVEARGAILDPSPNGGFASLARYNAKTDWQPTHVAEGD